MKLFVVFFIGFFCVINASPFGEHERWNLIPDEEGKLHVIDVNPIEDVVEPAFTPETDTRFVLFTRSNPSSGQVLTTPDSVRNSNFNSNVPVRVLIHGWNSGLTSGVNTRPTASYLQLGNFNVIQVDWSIGAGTANYITARNRVPLVARVLATFLESLVSNGLIPSMDRVSIAGHSLGAHIAGITGKFIQQGPHGIINTIWGMDPAGPLFSINSPNDRLDTNDARYTEGIRTDITNSGFDVPFCHADFYPNGGSRQPGCGLDLAGQCSHSRSHALFAETIVSNGFVAVSCASFDDARNNRCTGARGPSMGGEPGNGVNNLRGIFHLTTNGDSPFARG